MSRGCHTDGGGVTVGKGVLVNTWMGVCVRSVEVFVPPGDEVVSIGDMMGVNVRVLSGLFPNQLLVLPSLSGISRAIAYPALG